jgi:iron(II)-dependent oxidoreductase
MTGKQDESLDQVVPSGSESQEKKAPGPSITTMDDDDLTLQELSPWRLPWKAISVTVVILILIAGAIQIVSLASNRIKRLSESSIRTHGATPGNFRPMGGVVPHLSASLPISKAANEMPATPSLAVPAPKGISLPPGFVYIPAGPFIMGSDDAFSNFDEKPVHKVYLPPYAIMKTLVTNREYKEFIDQAHYLAPPGWKGRN